jgi:hypothetical protein
VSCSPRTKPERKPAERKAEVTSPQLRVVAKRRSEEEAKDEPFDCPMAAECPLLKAATAGSAVENQPFALPSNTDVAKASTYESIVPTDGVDWQKVKDALALRMEPAAYSTWVKRSEQSGPITADGIVPVRITTEAEKIWLIEELGGLITEVLQSLGLKGVAYTVAPDAPAESSPPAAATEVRSEAERLGEQVRQQYGKHFADPWTDRVSQTVDQLLKTRLTPDVVMDALYARRNYITDRKRGPHKWSLLYGMIADNAWRLAVSRAVDVPVFAT